MDIVCVRCSAAIPAADIDLGTHLARCQGCNAVFDVTAQVEQGSRALARSTPYLLVPPTIQVVEEGGGALEEGSYRSAPGVGRLVLVRSWASRDNTIRTIFLGLWSMMVFTTLATTCMDSGPFDAMMLFLLVFAAVGGWGLYHAVAGLLNKTWIVVTSDALTIKHVPLPWSGNRAIPLSDLKSLRYETVVTTGKHASTSYTLWGSLRGGESVELLRGLPSFDEARFITERVEEHLADMKESRGARFLPR
ncbi:hypothetical protein [Chondromyces apiculatus]|uniref:Uncharacterized protein n=1 Tax=Chondromyces apiculatus DSM 436 TaxID=1192034 RepID=A0A017TB29_9BACT|nr:hypothetical protein [Chondromyces apiculatus]EYF06092.1 Hypothetical protein CAP_2282 [Chondromyces apiculatus DSM 436]